MEFSDNVMTLEKGNKTYYILGTAHISQKSVEEVKDVIEAVQPDTVCVELCDTRYQSLTDDNKWKNLNIIQVVKQGKALMLLANLALSSFQKKMGDKVGVTPGAELLAGVNKAKEVGAKLILADRDIQVTLKRTWSNLSLWKKLLVLSGLMESVITNEEITEEDLEKLKEKDQLSEMMDEFAKAMPSVKVPLIDERDQYLMSKIEEAEGEKIVAVVGAGHMRGMKTWFGKEVDRERINKIPPKGNMGKIFAWLVPFLVLALMARGYLDEHSGKSLQQILEAWVLPNVVGTALLATIARAHPITIICGALSSPFTSLVPIVGAGMVAGLVEAYLRKPSVEDCERIPEDITSFKGFLRNNFIRVLVVFGMANFGSMLGSFIGFGWLVSLNT